MYSVSFFFSNVFIYISLCQSSFHRGFQRPHQLADRTASALSVLTESIDAALSRLFDEEVVRRALTEVELNREERREEAERVEEDKTVDNEFDLDEWKQMWEG